MLLNGACIRVEAYQLDGYMTASGRRYAALVRRCGGRILGIRDSMGQLGGGSAQSLRFLLSRAGGREGGM